jgi:hypothetical protein
MPNQIKNITELNIILFLLTWMRIPTVIPNPRLEGKETTTESCDRALVHPAHPNPTSRAVARNSANATRTTRMSIGELSTPKNTNRKQMWLNAHVY